MQFVWMACGTSCSAWRCLGVCCQVGLGDEHDQQTEQFAGVARALRVELWAGTLLFYGANGGGTVMSRISVYCTFWRCSRPVREVV